MIVFAIFDLIPRAKTCNRATTIDLFDFYADVKYQVLFIINSRNSNKNLLSHKIKSSVILPMKKSTMVKRLIILWNWFRTVVSLWLTPAANLNLKGISNSSKKNVKKFKSIKHIDERREIVEPEKVNFIYFKSQIQKLYWTLLNETIIIQWSYNSFYQQK